MKGSKRQRKKKMGRLLWRVQLFQYATRKATKAVKAFGNAFNELEADNNGN